MIRSIFVASLVLVAANHGSPAAERIVLKGVVKPVAVSFDAYGIPHVFAQSDVDAARAIGYLHARDRLWEMDMFRRQASGLLAEIMGEGALESDMHMRRLGIRRYCTEFWNDASLPAEFRAEIEAYCAGVNQRMSELTLDNLPAAFRMLDYQPSAWTPVDCLVMTKYMGWDQSGTEDDLWFGMIVERLGATAVDELWPLDRPYEIPTVQFQVDRDAIDDHKAAASDTTLPTGSSETFMSLHRRLGRARLVPRSPSYGSNNWAVAGSRTASGKPILASDPHLGFQLPSLWYAAHVAVPGRTAAGVMFPGNPTFVIGHTDHHAWGITNMQADAVDYFVETVKADEPTKYMHRGEWKTMDRLYVEIPLRGTAAAPLEIYSTVHGPVVSREGDRVITMCWTGMKLTREPLAFWRGQKARSLAEFLSALDDLQVPALNICYADIEGNIAIHPCGDLPVRTHGKGRVPLDGASGDDDWTGIIPRQRMPLAVNPPVGYVGSANGRPASIGYPYYLGWMWDVSYRTRRLHDLLAQTKGATLESMAAIQYDAYDKCAERFLPVMIAAIERETLADKSHRAALEIVSKWNYVATAESQAPAIWLTWFSKYRERVWQDEWQDRHVASTDGSWGFSGINRREPMLEVLEFITLEQPDSPWFDNRSTPGRETRDDIILEAFDLAMKDLAGSFGNAPQAWAWKNINELHVRSLSRDESLSRQGGPVPGTCFTLNPGSNVGPVGGGASWRMLVDFADPAASLGVYPGGQSEDPASRHYDDLIALWTAGQYAPLHAVAAFDKLPASARQGVIEFVP